MGKLRWYKRDPDAALNGMASLTIEERGAYNTVLDLIYSRDGQVDDDPRFICGWLRCDVRVWKRIRTRLIDLGKLYVQDGALRNHRADAEVDEGLGRVASVSEANRIKGIKSGEVRRKNKQLAEPSVEPKSNTTTSTTTEEESSLRSETRKAILRVEREALKRATRLPEDWQPSVADINFAKANGADAAGVLRESTKFKNHWLNKSGKDGRKINWSLAWQNWVLGVRSWGTGPPQRQQQPSFHEIAAEIRNNANGQLQNSGNSSPSTKTIEGELFPPSKRSFG